MGFRDLVIKGFKLELGDETQDPTEKLSGSIVFKAKKGDFNFICKTSREELEAYNQDGLYAWEQYVTCEVLEHYNDDRQRQLNTYYNAFRNKGKYLHIIIHRSSSVDAQKVFERFITALFNESSTMQINDRGKYIDIENIRIDFRCGDMLKLDGVRPDYYNTDSDLVSCFLQQSANKVNGKEIKDIDDLINMIKGVANGNSRPDKI